MAAKTKAKGLGKGLDALFGDAEVAPVEKKPAAKKKQTAKAEEGMEEAMQILQQCSKPTPDFLCF